MSSSAASGRAYALASATVVCVCNLKPVSMRGVASQAMVLAATSADGSVVELVTPPPGAAPGTRVSVPGYAGPPDAEINLKKSKVWASVQPDLSTDANRVACYKGAPLTVEGDGGGVCTAASVAGGTVG